MIQTAPLPTQLLRSPTLICLVLAAALWALLYFSALISAVKIWYISEIYTHGFFVFPICGYLIYRYRHSLLSLPIKPFAPALLPLALLSVLGVAAHIGRIGVVEHIATFATLPLLVLVILGLAPSFKIWFALLFSLFAIPIGDQLVPYLQEITADIAVAMLKMLDIPILRNGLYIEIPEGKFVVAEACSGIRFFIGSAVFGSVYAYVSYKSWLRRGLFFGLAIAVPILANALRVFGIILVGHYSNMKHAAGADHIVYGWVFFTLVLVVLVGVGETFAQHKQMKEQEAGPTHPSWQSAKISWPQIAALVILALTLAWKYSLVFANNASHHQHSIDQSQFQAQVKTRFSLPLFSHPEMQLVGQFRNSPYTVFLAKYNADKPGAELISGQNKLFDNQFRSKVSSESLLVKTDQAQFNTSILTTVSSYGQEQSMVYWYQFDGYSTSNTIKGKAYQIMDRLLGGEGEGVFVAVFYTNQVPAEQALDYIHQQVGQLLLKHQ